jgi:hypothetical protein
MLGTAIAYNLKKWLNYVPKTRLASAKAIEKEAMGFLQNVFSALFQLRNNEPKFLHSFF